MNNMKKIIFVSLIVLALGVANASLAATGKVTGRTVRIREKPDVSSTIVTNAYRNEVIKILGEEGDWYKVDYEGKVGYISKEFLETKSDTQNNNTNTSNENSGNVGSDNNNNTTSTVQENSSVTLPNTQEIINKKIGKESKLKLLPIFSSRTIGVVSADTEIEIVSEVNNWVQIKVGSNTGWIVKANISDTSTTNNTPETNNVPENNTQEEQRTGYEQKTAYVNTDTARVRETAGGKIIGNININDVVTIIGEEGDWYKITCKDFQNGFVSKSLITIGNIPTSRSLNEERKSEVSEEIEAAVESAVQPKIESEVQPQPQEQAEPEVLPESLPDLTTGSSDLGSEIAEYAQTFLGCRYVSGGTSPSGFDCSGFTQYVYSKYGYSLNRTASGQASNGSAVSRSDLQPGDVLLFQDYGRSCIGHAAIYIGNGNFVHAANPSRGVVIDNLNTNSYYNQRFVTARRIN